MTSDATNSEPVNAVNLTASCDVFKAILSSDLSDGAKLAAIAEALGAHGADEIAKIVNKPIRTVERHYAEVRKSRPVRKSADTQMCGTQISVVPQICVEKPAELRTETTQNCVVASRAPASMTPGANNELPSEVVIEDRNLPQTPKLESEGVRVGEEEFPHKVFVNCETIRHQRFTISLKSVELLICGRLAMPEIKNRCLAHALQWASEIEAGKLSGDVIPNKIANFLSASIMGELNRSASADMRLAKFGPKPTPVKPQNHVRRSRVDDDSWKDQVVKDMMERGLIDVIN